MTLVPRWICPECGWTVNGYGSECPMCKSAKKEEESFLKRLSKLIKRQEEEKK